MIGFARWRTWFEDAFSLVADEFAQADSRRRGRACVLGPLSGVARKNSWTLAEQAGDLCPDRMAVAAESLPLECPGRPELRARPRVGGTQRRRTGRDRRRTGFPRKNKEVRRVRVFLAYASSTGRSRKHSRPHARKPALTTTESPRTVRRHPATSLCPSLLPCSLPLPRTRNANGRPPRSVRPQERSERSQCHCSVLRSDAPRPYGSPAVPSSGAFAPADPPHQFRIAWLTSSAASDCTK